MSQLNSAAQHAQALVAGELDALARRSASGALRISGDPGGAIYLNQGRLAFAESAAVADLGSRLVNSRRLGVDQWRKAEQDSQPGGCAGDVLLSRGLIDPGEWQTLVRAAALDALVAMAIQLALGGSADQVSFTSEQVPCAVTAMPMDAASAWAYARHEAGRLTGQAVVPEARPRLAEPAWDELPPSWQTITVLGQMDGRASVRELAWRNGLALYAVMDWVARLIQHGACTVTSPEHALPGRTPGSVSGPFWPAADTVWSPPDRSLLSRVLAGIRQLVL